MGKCETSSASIGIKILLSDLIMQINDTNSSLIKDMLYDGFIEDENDYFNEVYSNIIHGDELTDHSIDFKEYITTQLTTNGSYHKSRYGHVIPTLDKGCLFDKYLLVPVKQLLSTERWGHNREGTNGLSRPMDFDLSVDIEKYKDIQKIEIVFLVAHDSG